MILVAGIGNIFLGDDAFGSAVAQRMLERLYGPAVRVVDYGIRGLDLAYALADNYDASIIVDTVARGNEAGTIYLIEPDLAELESTELGIESHAMNPVRVLAMARSIGAELKNVFIVGCEPHTFESDDGHMGLSPRVATAVERAIEVIDSLISRYLPKEAAI
jgi:hydrogenase maturation protease